MEQVLAVPSAQVKAHVPLGLVRGNEAELLAFIQREGKFHDRTPELENDKALRQIVVYVLVMHGGKILSYQRKNSADPRIERKHSLAFGGHVNTDDMAEGQHPVIMGRQRELKEEVNLFGNIQFEFAGSLNISREPIDDHHMGMVYLAHIDSAKYTLNETDKYMWSGWVTPEEAFQKFDKLESWSKEVLETLHGPALQH